MQVVRLRRAFAGAAVLVGALVVVPGHAAVAVGPCSSTVTRTLTGTPPAFTQKLAANERVDAKRASWTGTASYPVYFDSTADSCWTGGTVTGTFPVTTTWNVYHGNAGFGFAGPNFTLNGPRIFNYGDGIRARDNSDGFRINDAYLSYIHDDCIENDRLENGTVDHSFLDGCYVGFSARQSTNLTYDGHLNTMTIQNSLVRLQAMPTVYSGSAAGHGGWFKWDDVRGTSPEAQHHEHHLPGRPGPQPSGPEPAGRIRGHLLAQHDRVARPRRVPRDDVVEGELSRHRHHHRPHPVEARPPGPGTSGTRAYSRPAGVGRRRVDRGGHHRRAQPAVPALPVSPPAAGKTVTVYWSTAPGDRRIE